MKKMFVDPTLLYSVVSLVHEGVANIQMDYVAEEWIVNIHGHKISGEDLNNVLKVAMLVVETGVSVSKWEEE